MNRTKPIPDINEVIETSSGLKIIIHSQGTGKFPEPGQSLTVHTHGTLDNDEQEGFLFYSTRGKEPFQFIFGMGRVIAGWDEAFQYIKLHGRATLVIPPSLAYGDGYSEDRKVKPNSTLTQWVELMEVK